MLSGVLLISCFCLASQTDFLHEKDSLLLERRERDVVLVSCTGAPKGTVIEKIETVPVSLQITVFSSSDKIPIYPDLIVDPFEHHLLVLSNSKKGSLEEGIKNYFRLQVNPSFKTLLSFLTTIERFGRKTLEDTNLAFLACRYVFEAIHGCPDLQSDLNEYQRNDLRILATSMGIPPETFVFAMLNCVRFENMSLLKMLVELCSSSDAEHFLSLPFRFSFKERKVRKILRGHLKDAIADYQAKTVWKRGERKATTQ